MLLGAVVQVPLDTAALRVAARHDPGPRGAQLVGLAPELLERCLQGRVQLGVVKSQPDLAGELGQNPVVLLGERGSALGPPTTIVPEQLAGMADRGDADRAPGRPFNSAGIQTEAQALPETPAWVITGRSLAETTIERSRCQGPTRRARATSPVPV